MEEKPIIEEGAQFNWTSNNDITVITSIDYLDEDGVVHLTVKTGSKEVTPDLRNGERITAEDIYDKVEAGHLEPQ